MDEEVNESQSTPEASAEESPAGSESFSSSEGLVSLGGLIVLAGWFLFEIVLDDYGTPYLALLLAGLAVLLPRMGRSLTDSIAPLSSVMKAVGYLMGLLALFVVVVNIRFASGLLNEFTEILGALAFFGGSAIAVLGANAIKT